MLAGARGLAAFGVLVAPALSACGTYVPNIQEFGPSHVGQLLVQHIVHSVHCEVTNAIIEAVGRPGAPGSQNAEFMSDWGVQMTLTLTVDEKSSLSPNVVWTPSAFFSLGGGLSGAAGATRT